MECPKCHEHISAMSVVPDEQSFAMELQYEGEYLSAATLGGTITNMEQLLVAIAKEAGAAVDVYINGVSYGDHKARVGFLIIRRAEPPPADA